APADAAGGQAKWEQWRKVDFEDTMSTNPIGFGKEPNILYMTDSKGRDTGALYKLDLDSGERELIAENDKVDVGGALMHPTEKNIQAVSFNYGRNEWQVLDDSIAGDVAKLDELAGDGEWMVTG